MNNNYPQVSIIILNFNGLALTKKCVDSVGHITYPNYRLVIIDNNGGQKNGEILRAKYGKKHIVLENDKNLGYAGGNNVGIRYALTSLRADYVLILNNDTVVHPSFLEQMVKSASPSLKIGMVGATILQHNKQDRIDTIGLKLLMSGLPYKRTNVQDPLFCPSGACALYSAKMLYDIEMNGEFFDEDFFLYAEDVDLGFRGILRGYESMIADDAIVYHKVSATTKEQSPLSIYYGHRNTPLMILKNFPRSLLLRYGAKILFFQIITPIYYLFTNPRNIWTVVQSKIDALLLFPKMMQKRRLIQASITISNKDLVKRLSLR